MKDNSRRMQFLQQAVRKGRPSPYNLHDMIFKVRSGRTGYIDGNPLSTS